MNRILKKSNIIYFLSNKCSQTIGGVQTIMRLIEEAMPTQKFVENILVYNKNEIQLDKLPNVEIRTFEENINRQIQYYKDVLLEKNEELSEKAIIPGSKIIVFGVQKLLMLNKKHLKENEIIIFQSAKPDVTLASIDNKKVPIILRDRLKYIDKFLFYTEDDKIEIEKIIENSEIQCIYKSYIVPNPSKTPRKQICKYTNNVMYLGRFDFIQKNIKEYSAVANRIYPKFELNAYGYGISEFLLTYSKVNVKGIIGDITEVAKDNSILLLLSNSEGFGNVLVEAFSVGMPVIVYDSYPAARSIVEPSVGQLIPYGDTEGVEKAIKEILKDENTFMKYSNAAFEASKKYVKQDIVKRYIHVIEDEI
ncbi:glycosyltransferase [Brassicibacter mesophilus]|uniref:glycosyltransferase n=1 Tax=Brassicibacter mesophilus TaxID=745119 RepID=UPI003D193BCB